MKECTYQFMRSLGVGSWLAGFNLLGDAIDRVLDMGDDSDRIIFAELYLELADKYGMKPAAVDARMRGLLEIAWRNNSETKRLMETVMRLPLDRQPSVKKFVYAVADFLRDSSEG